MDRNDLKRQAMIFTNARIILLFLIAFSAINLIYMTATFFASGFEYYKYIPILLFTPQFVFKFFGGFAMAVSVIVVYFVCWFFANRERAFILVASVLFGIDFLIFVWYLSSNEFSISYLLFANIFMYGFTSFLLFPGVKAWLKLRGVSADDLQAILHRTITAADGETAPLRADDKKGRILLAANYENLQISIKRTLGLTELIINGHVYDQIQGIFELDYSLAANFRGRIISGVAKSTRFHMYIYVDDVMVAKKIRFI